MKQAPFSEDAQRELLSRLRRIEGQARGVQRMIEEGRDCSQIVQQLASMRAATHSASLFLIRHYARECAAGVRDGASVQPIDDLIELVLSAS
jgi:DNA-binding FrmR family transcriptional regulator